MPRGHWTQALLRASEVDTVQQQHPAPFLSLSVALATDSMAHAVTKQTDGSKVKLIDRPGGDDPNGILPKAKPDLGYGACYTHGHPGLLDGLDLSTRCNCPARSSAWPCRMPRSLQPSFARLSRAEEATLCCCLLPGCRREVQSRSGRSLRVPPIPAAPPASLLCGFRGLVVRRKACAACGKSEASLASSEAGKIRSCSRCKMTTYCSVDCQRKDWPIHQKSCAKPKETVAKVSRGAIGPVPACTICVVVLRSSSFSCSRSRPCTCVWARVLACVCARARVRVAARAQCTRGGAAAGQGTHAVAGAVRQCSIVCRHQWHVCTRARSRGHDCVRPGSHGPHACTPCVLPAVYM